MEHSRRVVAIAISKNDSSIDSIRFKVWICVCSFSPEYLVEQNVIIVTMNYRLSILGFLCLPDAGVYGNAGLKDQVFLYIN